MGDLYEALTWLQESLVIVMTRALPDIPDPDPQASQN
jgi:hypothetical protein